jgi:hypothetical protein
MTPDVPLPGEERIEEGDLGEPVEALRALSWSMDQRFAHKVRGRIERRAFAGELISLAWTAPIMMLLEFLRVPFEALAGRRRK